MCIVSLANFVPNQFWMSSMYSGCVVGLVNGVAARWAIVGSGVTHLVMPRRKKKKKKKKERWFRGGQRALNHSSFFFFSFFLFFQNNDVFGGSF
jgi:hypothetical protein